MRNRYHIRKETGNGQVPDHPDPLDELLRECAARLPSVLDDPAEVDRRVRDILRRLEEECGIKPDDPFPGPLV